MASTSSTQSPLLVPRGAREGKPSIPITRPVWIIGSRKGCHLHLQSEHVSQAHAVIINTGRGLFIKDLASRMHTYVNRLPVKEVQLKDGDKVQIGPFKFYFKDPTANPGDKPPVAPTANLRVVGEPIPLPLEDRVLMIGRRPSADIHLTEESVSTTHALIIDIDGEHYVRDLGSRTGTFLNGEKINRQAPLSPGDKLRIGETEMTYDTVVGASETDEEAAFEGSRLAMSLDESAAPIEAEPAAEAEPAGPLAVEDLDDALGLAPAEKLTAHPSPEPTALSPDDLDDVLGLAPTNSEAEESLPLEPAAADEEPEAPAAIEVSATSTPVIEPPAVSDIEPEPVAEEPAAEAPSEEPLPVEPPVDTSSRGRRGWKLWGTRQPAATPPVPPAAPKVEAKAPVPVPPPVVEAPQLSEPLELSEPPALSAADDLQSAPPPVVDLTPPGEPAALPTVDLSEESEATDELPGVEELTELAPAPEAEAAADEIALPLEPDDADASDTAYAVELSPSAGESAATNADRGEVTAGDLELSAVEESPAVDLESSTEQETAVATETEPSADEMFEGVDVDALALEALNEEPAKTEDVSATIDLEAAAEGGADESTTSQASTLDLVEPEAPTAPVEEPAAIDELPTKDDEQSLADEPLTMADEGSPEAPAEPPKPVTPPASSSKGDDLPPPLTAPVKLKPSTRRRKRGDDESPPRRGPMRGKGGKFISAAEAARLAADESLGEAEGLGEDESPGLSEVEPPEQSLTTDLGSEVLDSTEPTPESALSLEPVAPAIADEIPLPAEDAVPSDSVFGREVEEMGGSIAGDLVEPSAEPVPADEAPKALSPLEQIAADATHFVDTDTPSHVTIADEVENPEPAAEIIEHEEIVADAPEAEEPAPLELHDEPATPEAGVEEPEAESTLELTSESEPEIPAIDEPAAETPLELPAIAEEPVTLQLNGLSDESELNLDEPEAPAEIESTIEASPLDLPTADELLAAAEPPEAELETPPVENEVEAPQELSFDETFEPSESTTLAGDAIVAEPSATDSETAEPAAFTPEAADDVQTDQAPEPESPAAPQPPAGAPNLGFFGIARDADTFLGGMPLSLPPLPPPPPTFGKVGLSFGESQKGNPHAAPLPPPLIIGHDDEDDTTAEAPADEVPIDEAPPELPADYTATGAPIQEPGSTGLTAGDTDSTDTTIPPLPVQEASATSDHPKMPVPPRPRRNRLADYEKRFAKVDEDAAIEAMQRELNKPRPEQASASGFDGLTLGPAVRQTDVFSDAPGGSLTGEAARPHDPFLADKQASIDLAARNIDSGRVPPMPMGLTAAGTTPPPATDTPTNGPDPFALPPVARKAEAPSDRIDRNDRTPPRLTARPAPAPDFNYTGPQRGGRKIPIRVLVAAMVVFMIGAGVAGFMLTPVKTSLLAKASFANLKDRTPFEQHRFRTEQQAVLTSEVVRTQAKALLNQDYPARDAGLLSDPLAFDALARDLEWPQNTNEMRLKLDSVDPEGDKLRLGALLKAIESENKKLLREADIKKAEFEKAQAELDLLNTQMKDLQVRIRDAQNSADDKPGASLITAVEQEAASLRGQWDEANEKVTKLKFEVERLAPGGVMPQLEGGETPLIDNIVGGDPEKDPVVVATREQLKGLQDEIRRLKDATSEDATENARKALDKAIETFRQENAKLHDGKGAEWQDFLAKAEKLKGMAELMTGAIIQSQRDEQNKLAELKRRLEQELADRREKRFEASAELKAEVDANRLASRQFNVAMSEGNLAAEAARYKAMIDQTEAKIIALRAELSKDPEKEAEIAKVQKLIDDGKASISTDRRSLDAGMAETLKDFLASGRELYKKLSAEDKTAAESLAARAGEMVEANQIYGNLVNSIKDGATDELRKKEADAQRLAAKIESQIAAVKDADRKNKSDLEKQATIRQIEKAKTDLAAAEAAQKAASDTWVAKQQQLADLRAKAGIAKAADDKLQENLKARDVLQASIASKIRELDDKRKTGVASIVPEPIADDAVTEGPRNDDRWKYALIASAGVCALFLVLIWLGGYHQTPPSGGHRPVIESATAPTTERAGDDETVTV